MFVTKLIKFFLDKNNQKINLNNINSNNSNKTEKITNFLEMKLSELTIEMDIISLNIFKIVNFINLTDLNEKLKWTFNSILNEEKAKILGLINEQQNKENHCIDEINAKNKNKNKKASYNKLDYKQIKSYEEKFLPNLSDLFLKFTNNKFLKEIEKLKKIQLSNEFYNNFFSSEKFHEITNFLISLTCIDEDGSIIMENSNLNSNSNETLHNTHYILGQYAPNSNINCQFLNSLKFILTNANRQFDKIIKEARSVILAGGTMKPMEEFDILFSCLNDKKNQIIKFEGKHVVDKQNIFVSNLILNPFDFPEIFTYNHHLEEKLKFQKPFKKINSVCFNYENFKNNSKFLYNSMLEILLFHKSIIFDNLDEFNKKLNNNLSLINAFEHVEIEKKENNLINYQIACGIVAFVTSYEILENFKKYYEKAKNDLKNISVSTANFNEKADKDINQNYLINNNFFHEIIFEDKTGKIDAFSIHQGRIKTNIKNSILIAVVGGKLSEGINFSDNLARCVILFGMPYPNLKSHEIKIKMEFYNSLYKEGKSSISGDDYYENICMKAVNQTIGRAIRHRNDFSAIVLVDYRYKSTRIRSKLSKWVTENKIFDLDEFEKIIEYQRELKDFIERKLI